MKINRIELYNIGSYEELNVFDIAAQNNKGKISIIGGKNGAGKTTLFSGIKLCLYGHKEAGYQAINTWYKNSIKRLINDKAKLENNATAYVLLELSIFNGQDWDIYKLKRQWNLESSDFEIFTVEQNNKQLDLEEIVDFENFLLNLIPPELFDLYFFDGEQIADFFLEGSNDGRIKNAFLTICGYDTFDILYKNFKRLSRTVDVDNDALNHYFKIEEELTGVERKLKSCRGNIQNILDEIVQIDSELDKTEKQFLDHGGVSIEAWNQKFIDIKAEERIREEKNAWLKNAMNDTIPYIILKNQISELLTQIYKEQEDEKNMVLQEAVNDTIPAVLRDFQIDCPEVTDEIVNSIILKIKESVYINGNADSILKLSKEETRLLIVNITSLLELDSKQILAARKVIKQSIKKGQKLRNEIESSNISSIDQYMKDKEQLLSRKQELINQQEVCNDELKLLEKEVERVDSLYKLASKALDKKLKSESVADLTTKSILFLDTLQKRLFKSEIEKVQDLFMFKMNQLMRKEKFISNIIIDDDFNVHVYKQVRIDSKGVCDRIKNTSDSDYINEFGEIHCNDILQVSKCKDLNEFVEKFSNSKKVFDVNLEFDKSTMSKGEKQVFIMALYWSIMQLCNKEIPFIIDTPFARIDTEHRAHITEFFFKELKGQVLIFSTDEEITSEHMKVIGNDLQSKFIIENIDNKRTAIESGKYFGE